jgi:hypothetical protein
VVSEGLRARTQAFIDAMSETERAEYRLILRRTIHLLMCTPNERISHDKMTGGAHWRRDLAPDIDGVGCICAPMLWNDCEV